MINMPGPLNQLPDKFQWKEGEKTQKKPESLVSRVWNLLRNHKDYEQRKSEISPKPGKGE